MSKTATLPLRVPNYWPSMEQGHTLDIRRYVEERLAEQPLSKPILDVQVDVFPEAYHAIVRVATTREDIPYEMRELAADIQDVLMEQGYPVFVILRPAPNSL